MGKRTARFNQKARASSRSTTALVHAKPRDKVSSVIGRTGVSPSGSAVVLTASENSTLNEVIPSQSTTAQNEYQSPSVEALKLQALVEQTKNANGLSSKRQKRLDKFIGKQLKKESSRNLMAAIASKTMAPEHPRLLLTASRLGKTASKKDTVRMDMLRSKAGLALSSDSRLILEKDNPNFIQTSPLISSSRGNSDISGNSSPPTSRLKVQEDSESDFEKETTEPNHAQVHEPSKSLIAQAFGSVLAKKSEPEIVSHGVQGEVAPVKNSFGSALKRKAIVVSKMRLPSKTRENSNSVYYSSSSSSEDDEKSEFESVEKHDVKIPQLTSIHSSTSIPAPTLSSKRRKIQEAVEKSFLPGNGVFFDPINRSSEFALSRLALPVVGDEQEIMEAIRAHDVILLSGETGSGKTTQLPQFLYEAGYGNPSAYPGMIGITQPRRVAAVSMATRVAEEMGSQGACVAYQIRHQSTVVPGQTRIKFMTDGILLREANIASNDVLLTRYSCIIIDEAHERSLNTDILLGYLSRVVGLRNSGKVPGLLPLKVIIMSATLAVDELRNPKLFPVLPPVITVKGRQHKVVIHYNKHTPSHKDHITAAFSKIVKIHSTLPSGGILVFLSASKDINTLVKRLQVYAQTGQDPDAEPQTEGKDEDTWIDPNDDFEYSDVDEYDDLDDESNDKESEIVDLNEEEEETEVLPSTIPTEDQEQQGQEESSIPQNAAESLLKMHVLPLYSMLGQDRQMKVFADSPAGTRKIIIATNIAETSLTIPGISYVVDAGKAKRKVLKQSGIFRFETGWATQSACEQRAGRAGRQGPGHCYRLYSSAVYHTMFARIPEPEITQTPLEGVLLQLKSIGINKVENFPFPTPPGAQRLVDARILLKHLGAISPIVGDEKITEDGKCMAQLSVAPRLSKVILSAARQTQGGIAGGSTLPHALMLAATMTVGNPLKSLDEVHAEWESARRQSSFSAVDSDVANNEDEGGIDAQRKALSKRWYAIRDSFSRDGVSDVILWLNAASACYLTHRKANPTHQSTASGNTGQVMEFIKSNFLKPKVIIEILALYAQLERAVNNGALGNRNTVLPLPALTYLKARHVPALLKVLCTGFPDQIAKRLPTSGKKPVYAGLFSNAPLMIHSMSVVASRRSVCNAVVFSDLSMSEQLVDDVVVDQAQDEHDHASKKASLKMMGVSMVELEEIWDVFPPTIARKGSPVSSPSPEWSEDEDMVLGTFNPSLQGRDGVTSWTLAPRVLPLDLGREACMYFGLALMEGRVISALGSVALPKTTSASVMLKATPKAARFIAALQSQRVASKAALLEVWTRQRRYLLEEVCEWIPTSVATSLRSAWPPVNS